ncbi:MAG TPA: enoyl-[acyl-carrier-protein] reductase FabV [Actinocrinis sp.]|nr:enoyl-[acyl-carrier-protein] reductase FabV [Actinocrinis sp.]
MAQRVISVRNRGFLFLDSHPAGCAELVQDMWTAVPALDPPAAPAAADAPVALVIGCSAGYGLAATVAGLARHGIRGVGVAFEKGPDRRTGTAGWYRTAAADRLVRAHGHDFVFLNGDAFSDPVKDQVAELLQDRFGGRLDYLVYSVAAPRRTDPDTGTVYSSVLKPIGGPSRTKTLAFDGETGTEVTELETQPAGDDEIAQTISVMGGDDWRRWIDHLGGRGLLADGFTTVALSYIGSPLTAALYREGTIGAAKQHLERTARDLSAQLAEQVGGRALTSVNGAAVTQASTAIPGIALYVSLLREVLGDRMLSPIAQLTSLWDQLVDGRPPATDDQGRVRLDTWELDPEVQDAVAERWQKADTDNIAELADLAWFSTQVRQLYGFAVPGIDCAAPVEVDEPWPAAER